MHKRIFLVFSLLFFAFSYAAADLNGVSMTASVNRTSLTTEDELKLTVTIDGVATDVMPQLPSLPAFNVYASAATKEINNFHAVSTFEYIMLPRFAGKTLIGPVTLHYGNKMYQTQPIEVTVYRPSQAPAPAPAKTPSSAAKTSRRAADKAPAGLPPLERDLYNLAAQNGDKAYFMVAAVENAKPYVNQTVTLAVRFYYSRPFVDNAPYTAPAISNLFMEEIGTSDGSQTISGRVYAYMEKRYALSGVAAGKAQAGAATVKYIPTSGRASMLDRMLALRMSEPETASSNPISLDIRPVPAELCPKNFYGAVGSSYQITASADRREVEAGEAVNLTIKVTGEGNLKPTADLKLPALPGFRVYDVASTSGVIPANGTLRSYKIFKAVIVPLSSGEYVVPGLFWSYFDPKTKTYRTLRTEPIALRVTPSTKEDAGFDFGANADLGGGFRQLGQDIRYLKASAATQKPGLLTKIASYGWLLWGALVLLALAGVVALLDKSALAGKRERSKVLQSLKNAKNAEAVSDALSAFILLRYGVHTASLPLRDIVSALKKRSCPANLLDQFQRIWQLLDAARFAPAHLQNQNAQELARQAAALIKEMEKGSRS